MAGLALAPMQPEIKAQRVILSNPWISVIERDVQYPDGIQSFYSLGLRDYVTIVARTASGRLPLIRQFRPAVEDYTLELPAGLLEPGEDPRQAALRELLEETGLESRRCDDLGTFMPDTGRLSNRAHIFRVEAGEPDPNFETEPGLELLYVTPAELASLIEERKFAHLLHLSAVYLSGFLAEV